MAASKFTSGVRMRRGVFWRLGVVMIGYMVVIAAVLAVALALSPPSWVVAVALFVSFVGFGTFIARRNMRSVSGNGSGSPQNDGG